MKQIDKNVSTLIQQLKDQIVEYPTYKIEKPNIVDAIGNVQFLLRLFSIASMNLSKCVALKCPGSHMS